MRSASALRESARDQFQASEAVVDDLSAKLTKADERTGLTGLQLVERAAHVKAIGDEGTGRALYLFAQVVSAGGAFRVSTNFFRMVFSGDALSRPEAVW